MSRLASSRLGHFVSVFGLFSVVVYGGWFIFPFAGRNLHLSFFGSPFLLRLQ